MYRMITKCDSCNWLVKYIDDSVLKFGSALRVRRGSVLNLTVVF